MAIPSAEQGKLVSISLFKRIIAMAKRQAESDAEQREELASLGSAKAALRSLLSDSAGVPISQIKSDTRLVADLGLSTGDILDALDMMDGYELRDGIEGRFKSARTVADLYAAL